VLCERSAYTQCAQCECLSSVESVRACVRVGTQYIKCSQAPFTHSISLSLSLSLSRDTPNPHMCCSRPSFLCVQFLTVVRTQPPSLHCDPQRSSLSSSSRLILPHPVSAPLTDLLHRMLDKDPTTRITVSQAKQHPWVLGDPENSSKSELEHTYSSASLSSSPSPTNIHSPTATTPPSAFIGVVRPNRLLMLARLKLRLRLARARARQRLSVRLCSSPSNTTGTSSLLRVAQ
jgi:serine/threonine protein kinase